jgi:hypothetical protein
MSSDLHDNGTGLRALQPMRKPFSLGSLLGTIRESFSNQSSMPSWGERLEKCLEN